MSDLTNTLSDICPSNKCNGCMACYNICHFNAIQMVADDEGFLYPKINQQNCTNCHMCVNVCPSLSKEILKEEILENQEIYAAWSLNNEIREKSSSGGVFSHLAKYILSKGGVIFGAGYDNNFNVIHKYVDTEDDYLSLIGSKYVQSFIGNSYQIVLKYLVKERDVLFVGTPCQVAGLMHYLSDIDITHLYTVDLVCHGVSSPMVFNDFKNYMENKYNSPITNICFRDKQLGWKEFSLSMYFRNGNREYKKLKESPFLNFFLSNMILRESCYQCPYANLHRQGDITLCDFWGYHPHFIKEHDDDKGISGIIVNSLKGKKLLHNITKKLYITPRLKNELTNGQRMLHVPCCKPENRNLFWKDYKKYGFPYVIKKYHIESVENKTLNKFKQNYQILIEWLIKKQQNISITDYFIKNNYHRIAIYGMGELGLRTIDELYNTEIEIVYGIDKNNISPYNNIPIVPLTNKLEMVDAIIVSVITDFKLIKMELQYYITCPIISLKDIIFYN